MDHESAHLVTAPFWGVFRLGEGIHAGQVVAADTELGQLLSGCDQKKPIRAEIAGVLLDILVKDGEMPEFGQPLFRIAPIAPAK